MSRFDRMGVIRSRPAAVLVRERPQPGTALAAAAAAVAATARRRGPAMPSVTLPAPASDRSLPATLVLRTSRRSQEIIDESLSPAGILRPDAARRRGAE